MPMPMRSRLQPIPVPEMLAEDNAYGVGDDDDEQMQWWTARMVGDKGNLL